MSIYYVDYYLRKFQKLKPPQKNEYLCTSTIASCCVGTHLLRHPTMSGQERGPAICMERGIRNSIRHQQGAKTREDVHVGIGSHFFVRSFVRTTLLGLRDKLPFGTTNVLFNCYTSAEGIPYSKKKQQELY